MVVGGVGLWGCLRERNLGGCFVPKMMKNHILKNVHNLVGKNYDFGLF